MGLRRLTSPLVLLLLGAGCGQVRPFMCVADSQCVAGGVFGTCESTGYCSFPDDACLGGRRYGMQASAELAGVCVAQPEMDAAFDAAAVDAAFDAAAVDGMAASDAEGGPDAPPSDSAVLDAVPGCDWSSGPAFGPIVPVTELNTAYHEVDISLSADGLTAFFGTNRPGGAGEGDLWQATRATASSPFTVTGVLSELNSTADDGFAHVTADGLELIFHSARLGMYDLFSSTRASPASAFSAPQKVIGLSTAEHEWDPTLTPDGLTVYYGGMGSLGDATSHLLVAHRPDRASPFGEPVLVPGVAVFGVDDAGPSLTSDERVMVWHSQRDGGAGSTDLWYAVRTDRTAAFGVPLPLADLNTAGSEAKPFLRADGCELWFVSDRPGGSGSTDFYRVEIQP